GGYAVLTAEFGRYLGALIEAVNRVGSFFYGGLLGVFVLAFFFPRVRANGAFYGVLAGDDLLLVTSERKLIQADELPDGLTLDNRGFDLCRFSREDILAFLSGASIEGHAVLRTLETYFRRFVIFRDARIPLFLATWTLGTYVYKIFRAFPYMALRSPVKRCGKSRVLDLLSLVCFNASSRTTNPTEAQLFRGPSKNGGTLLQDEVEHLRGDKEVFAGLLAVLNSGFERGGSVSRMEKRGDRFEEVSFPTYCPRALAGISQLADTLEDRSLIIFMTRKLKSEPVERFSPGRLEAEAQRLRDDCYIWSLTHAGELAEVYEADDFPGLEDLDDRARDLWEPLLSIALLADAEAREVGEVGGFADTLTVLARDLAGVRDEGDTVTARLVEGLGSLVEAEGRETFTPSDLLKFLQAKGFEWVKSTRSLAGLLNPLGLCSGWRWSEGRSVRAYVITQEILADLKARYGEEVHRGEEAKEP
ncbi:MAG: DUF3631 domain-containing protein, partial [candidate division NC10 bacterium]|nr:DUF3631 domain-containing protein [candidate division NC10 bacterium]